MERIYLGNGKSMQVTFTEVFDSSEMEDLVPEEGRSGRFELYISPSGDRTAARACGVYGLLNEFTAYCWQLANMNRIEPFVDQEKVFGVYYTDPYLSWAEFRQFILAYMLYAKENYPAVYQDIAENESFREAFTAIDTRFQKEVATYRANHDMYPKYETKYQALTAEMNKKEYLEMIEILKP